MSDESTAAPAPVSGAPAFDWRERKDGAIEILHRERPVSLLRGPQAQAFAARIAAGTAENGQRLMARLTGNYRRGNERTAKQHPRNRD